MRIGAPWYWYEFYSKHELQLLEAFVRNVESQIIIGINHYQENKKSELVVLSEEEGIAEVVDHYAGLESMSWNLDDLFKDHFPNLQRKSAFLTLYAFLEYELDRLANQLRIESKLVVQPSDLSGQGVFRSLSYMEKVVVLDIDKAEVWGKIARLNELRNLIVHNDGNIVDNVGGLKSKAVKALNQLRPHVVQVDNEVKLKPTFLNYVLNSFDKLFQYLNKAVELKYAAKRRRVHTFSKIRLKGKRTSKASSKK